MVEDRRRLGRGAKGEEDWAVQFTLRPVHGGDFLDVGRSGARNRSCGGHVYGSSKCFMKHSKEKLDEGHGFKLQA